MVLLHLFCLALAMFAKRGKPYDPEAISPSRRLRANLEDLFVHNDVSAERAAELFEDAHQARAPGFRKLARIAKRNPKHLKRDFLRNFNKSSKWTSHYIGEVRVWDAKTQSVVWRKIPFMLPHELLHALLRRHSNEEVLLEQRGLARQSKANLVRAARELNLEAAYIVPLGLWVDGVPCNWDRGQSLEVVCLSFPGGTSQVANMRLPLTVLNKKFVCEHTFEDIFNILQWSMTALAANRFPQRRHDGLPWEASDSRRQKLTGEIGLSGLLVEVRADWQALKQVFKLPGWRDKASLCWRCDATPASFRQVGADATWRLPAHRLDHWHFAERTLRAGKKLSGLFRWPGVTTETFCIDWLHIADLGVTCDFLGGLFWSVLPKLEGNSQEARCKALFTELHSWYRLLQVPCRLDNLTLKMLKKKKGSPKLRAKAAEARALVPFAVYLANKYLEDSPEEVTVKNMAVHLEACYCMLSEDAYNSDLMKENSRKFALLYVAMEALIPSIWRVKPKLHLFQELCEESDTCPSTCWTYRDEDFGGSLASMYRRRGGWNTPWSGSLSCLQRFYSRHKIPSL